jgi:hypothetical protein
MFVHLIVTILRVIGAIVRMFVHLPFLLAGRRRYRSVLFLIAAGAIFHHFAKYRRPPFGSSSLPPVIDI